jgi:outer membrane protein OmpA-like peptidoglycan-associated protein
LIIGAAVIGILMLAAGAFVAGRWFFPDDASATPAAVASSLPSVPSSIAPPTTLVPADPIVGARAAIEAAGVEGVDVRIEGDAAVLTGTVMSEPDREAAARAVLAVPGIVRLDNRVTVAAPAPADPIEVQFAAEAALAAAGLEHLAVAVDGRVAVISGVIPLDALSAGYFAYTEPARAGLLAIEGIDAVSSRLQLRGDEAALRGELEELIDLNPIIFSSGNSEIDEQAAATLNEAARIIISHPGLRVLIAGHTDSAGSTGLNEALAQQRGAAVLGYLVGRGVPITRLQAVSYGELFPDSEAPAALNRRIEFEVAP